MATRAPRATTKKLNAVTKRLLGHYTERKRREAKQKKERDSFFDLLTSRVEADKSLAQKTIALPELFFTEPAAYVETYHPEWRILAVDDKTDGETGEVISVVVLLEERPELKAATWINDAIGMVFAKQVRQGSAMLDDDRLMLEDPWLYNDLLERVWQIKPLDDLDGDTLSRLQPYLYRGKPTVALQAPRPATEEELAGS